MVYRYICSLVWIILLCGFSYGQLIVNFVIDNGTSFDALVLKMHSSEAMVLTNMGLVLMLLVDNTITGFLTKREVISHVWPHALLAFAGLLIIGLAACAEACINGTELVSGFYISYIFLAFVIVLIVYKAETLKISHHTKSGDIKNGLNVD